MTDKTKGGRFHTEHPLSSIVDRESTVGTLYNVGNILTALEEIVAEKFAASEKMAVEVMLNGCTKAVYFEAWRLENPE